MICVECNEEIEDAQGVWIHANTRKNWCKRTGASSGIRHAHPVGTERPPVGIKSALVPTSEYARGYNSGYIAGARAAKKINSF